jgi:uncharacterized protein YhaN
MSGARLTPAQDRLVRDYVESSTGPDWDATAIINESPGGFLRVRVSELLAAYDAAVADSTKEAWMHAQSRRAGEERVAQAEAARDAVRAAAEALLQGGTHDGPCDNADAPDEACEQHVAAYQRRAAALREALDACR